MKYAASTQTFLSVGIVMGIVQSVCIIVQALTLTDIVTGLFLRNETLDSLRSSLYALIGAIAIRALATWFVDVSAQRASTQVKSDLRKAVFSKAMSLGPIWMNSRRAVETTTLLTRGVDALDIYFSRYLPSLLLASVAPILLGAVVVINDGLSAAIIVLTIPLIPFFMILIGKLTNDRVARQWNSLNKLSQHFSDLISGLPTLRIFGQSKNQRDALIKNGNMYQNATMSVLRISFLSALVLELIATLSVALIAVSIGVRLISGSITLEAGLLILILAPDIYLPIRQVGMNFHAAADGLEAASRIFEILESEETSDTHEVKQELSQIGELKFTNVALRYSEDSPLVLSRVSFTVFPGSITALVGPSGSGKSTVLNAVMKYLPISQGTVSIGDQDISLVSSRSLRSHVTYLPQRPWMPAGTLEQAIRVSNSEASHEDLLRVCRAAGLSVDGSDSALPHGLNTEIQAGGAGISAGQLRRIGIARTLLSPAEIVIMDEPTAALDVQTEALIISTLQDLRDSGKIILVIAHRPSVIAIADQAIDISEWSHTLRTDTSQVGAS